jgi:hypothetical protein
VVVGCIAIAIAVVTAMRTVLAGAERVVCIMFPEKVSFTMGSLFTLLFVDFKACASWVNKVQKL